MINLKQLSRFIDKLATENDLSGAILIAKDAQIHFKQAYGLASRRFNVPNQIDTKFNLGSINKMFTAVAIAQLAQAGKLAFSDKVAQHLPDYPNKAVAEKVSIHQLLTHTAGLGNYFQAYFKHPAKDQLRSVSDFVELFVNDSLAFEPGEKWSYSNAGFILLGAIIEAITGSTYFNFVYNNIYKVAEMHNTDCYEMDKPIPNLAIGYTKLKLGHKTLSNEWRNNLYLHVVKGGPAGGGFSTVEDLFRFAQALRHHQLLDAEYTKILTTGKVALNPNSTHEKYAYGFFDHAYKGARIVSHHGQFQGIAANLDIFPESGYTTVILLNQYDLHLDKVFDPLAYKIRDMISAQV